jgi:hypothetical protein
VQKNGPEEKKQNKIEQNTQVEYRMESTWLTQEIIREENWKVLNRKEQNRVEYNGAE